ncbi:Ff.00g131620.m01.CDS01 [Fusarium sp. VM40]|nr:Ff.00g131620.m01.CDS01 [Fusarium sp. VM40]
MVNRGGRSKACRTCKRRRVKCDHGKPNCQRCEKAGLRCEGYVIHGEFVDETIRFSKHATPPKNSQLQLQLANTPSKTIGRISSPSPLLLDENTVIHTHLLSKIDEVKPLMSNLDSFSPNNSTRTLAIRALAGIYFGKMNYNKRISDSGTRDYVRALKSVQVDLACSTVALEWDTLASVVCLCMFENIAFTDKTGWLKHYEGITQLVKLRGPSRHQTPLDRELLRQCRFEIIVCALISRSHCYLTLPEWRSIPWPASVPKTASDTLHDIFARVPGHLHDMDSMERGEVDDMFVHDLRQRVETTLSDLEDWEQFHHHPRPLTSLSNPTLHSAHSTRDKTLLALQRAIILCMSRLCAFLDIPLVAEIPAAFEDRQAVRTAIASEIYQLATSCVGHTTTGTGPLLFIFPLQVASMNFGEGSVEERRSDEVMNEVIAGTHGFEIGRRRAWRTARIIPI